MLLQIAMLETTISNDMLQLPNTNDYPSSAVLPSYSEPSPYSTLGHLEFGIAQSGAPW
jgi:hypothetical protein